MQGVGFRPFVYRLAVRENLTGLVTNTASGVIIEAEGDVEALTRFHFALREELPPLAEILRIQKKEIDDRGDTEFRIEASRPGQNRTALVSPDMTVCDDCLRELLDSHDRRFHYPFINCTNCGPRFTIIEDIPYDRPNTTMKAFPMCDRCQGEYDDPLNRRFHAQPNACPVCGPRVWFAGEDGKELPVSDPIERAAQWIARGKIVAVKGLGGFHLMCDAAQDEAVLRLRKRKSREEKPLAVMARNMAAAHTFCRIDAGEMRLLESRRRPIVLLQKRRPFQLADAVAPGNCYVGVMLPYTPLHELLLSHEIQTVVATSGNLSEEPIAMKNSEAVARLGGIADAFLLHNRPIFVRCDDSVTRVLLGLPRPIRRSRGYAPHPVILRRKLPPVLAVGAELKNTFCLIKDDRAFLSQHIGDLENRETLDFFEESVTHLRGLLDVHPQAVACDLHPDYLSTQWAHNQGAPRFGVQHHHAHIASCLADNGRDETVIGLAMDGTGYGLDGAVWGGEALIAGMTTFSRGAHLAYRPMPGGEAAIREPWRMAVAYIGALHGGDFPSVTAALENTPLAQHLDFSQVKTMLAMSARSINSPHTSSLGRLFDGVAALLGLRTQVAYEGQAAVELEQLMSKEANSGEYEWSWTPGDTLIVSPDPLLSGLIGDLQSGVPAATISRKFHQSVVSLFVHLCEWLRQRTGLDAVALSGGCFLNRFLLENSVTRLEAAGFEVLTHCRVPTNDGGISLGQACSVASRLAS